MITLVIPTLNEEKHIGIILEKLNPQLEEGDEILIVDGFSKDRTTEIAKKMGARVITYEKTGIGPAKTEGARKAKGDIVVFLDADAIPTEDFVQRIRKHFKDPEILAVGGLDLYEADSEFLRLVYNTYSAWVFYGSKTVHYLTGSFWIPSNNSAFRKEVFLKAGGYGPLICEETDLMKRLPKSRKVKYDSKMIMTLSDRRFKREGFIKTVALWGWSNISAIGGKGVSIEGYRKD
ncbi:glycosyltransferase [Candidatus Micrarchaeota archaeon]|nr:glycosyltransferase [Candidatus Micrarchaeota archaeon]